MEKKILFTVGPTELSPVVPEFIREATNNNICSISHRSRAFEEIYKNTISSTKLLLKIPGDFHVLFASSATEIMERLIENCVAQKSFHFVNGAFSQRFFTIAKDLKKSPEKIEVEWGRGFNFSQIQIPKNAEIICFVQNETSTGATTKMEDIYKVKLENQSAIVAVDIVSSAPYVDIDYSLIDCAFFSVQKGFGLPAGLGVLILNNKCIEKSLILQKEDYNIGSYHKFSNLLEKADRNQTPETPNVLGIYLLSKVCDYINNVGIENIRQSIDQKAKILYGFFDNHPEYEPFVNNENIRSKTVIVINTQTISGNTIEKLENNGFIVSPGYGKYKNKQIRIANYPVHSIEDVERMLRILE